MAEIIWRVKGEKGKEGIERTRREEEINELGSGARG
jgi:hypothetical protein